jgi:ribonuclease E
VALQLLRGLEEILMKGATHNLVVRTRTDVALYVLNHKRGHLRDLENSFKVTLAVIADPTVSGQQSFIIDRGEQVHTLEAAKALLAAQVAAFPAYVEEASDDEEPFDIETESEVETEETEGLADDAPVSEASDGETDADGHKRKRRRRRRGRPGEARDGAPARDESEIPHVVSETAVAGAVGDESESDEDEAEEQPGAARADQGPGGERRPRRRGRRGGRRRRGGPEDGLAGSIADELGPASVSEATDAVADLDGYSAEPSLPVVQPESIAPLPEQQYADPGHADPGPQEAPRASLQEAPRASVQEETTQEAERAARRRSTVREKVSFLVDDRPDAAAAAVNHSQPEPTTAPPAPTPTETAPEATDDGQPRRAGWWSRRFGSGE